MLNYRNFREGIINISVALLLLLLSSIAAVMISGVMKEVLDISQRVEASIDSQKSRIAIMSAANIWSRFLTENGGLWDNIQPVDAIGNPKVGSALIIDDDYLKVNLAGSERIINYIIESTTVMHSVEDKYISVEFGLKKDGEKLPFGATFDFGWPGF
ncbi:hypothetical protein SAMN04488510_11645 [Fervidobacterium changbaicum]|uniref:Uncharacterized protein n=2 Tax=Fervidobacterium TaxID=2422 RepID=A0AAI8GDC8_FERIS|nr:MULTISPECIES: hypothetical protein [Fervidobacterium]AMW32877.1 hypothetical protein NA23_06100 [Fervidobacterium islandicum]QAV32914.1 hypothetical protein CBS1_03620 [Fervidobacterium changbaicum]SDH48538.1 hypothetical protein SAMN04488510_11645 [Fervidobacterium changbaicum]